MKLSDYSNKESNQDKKINKDIWSVVWNELSPIHPTNFKVTTHVSGYDSRKSRYQDEDLGVVDEGIRIYADNADGLKFAREVAGAYNLEFKLKVTRGNKISGVIIIPDELLSVS